VAAKRYGRYSGDTQMNFDEVRFISDKDNKLLDTFVELKRLRGKLIRLKTNRQLVPKYNDPDTIDDPCILETFMPIGCAHLPTCKTKETCSVASHKQALRKRTFYNEHELFERLNECMCGHVEKLVLNGYLFDIGVNRLRFRNNKSTDMMGAITCPKCSRVLYAYWLELKMNRYKGFITPQPRQKLYQSPTRQKKSPLRVN